MDQCQKHKRGSLENLFKRLFAMKKRNSKPHTWDINMHDFLHIIQLPCFYCGKEPSNKLSGAIGDERAKKYPDTFYQGIDRLDAKIGYTKTNVVPCCWICNRIKGRHSAKELLWHVQKMLPMLTALVLNRRRIKSGLNATALISELEDAIIKSSFVK